MKTFLKLNLFAGLSLAILAVGSASAQTVIVSDTFKAVNVTNGFLLGAGINSDINPPTSTRLTGTAAANLRYLRRGNKLDNAYSIGSNRANITKGAQSGRFTISEDGSVPFDFAPALGVSNATPANPIVYDVGISMNNKVVVTNDTVGKMTFAFGTTEGGGGNWSFGIQIVPVLSGDVTNYNIFKRVRAAASGLPTELNQLLTNAITAGTEVTFQIRVTDAGAESDTNSAAHSRVQLSLDGGTNWFYDTQSDTNLPNGFRFEAGTRFVSFDQAPNDGADTYDNFSIVLLDSANAATLAINNNGGTANVSLQGTPGQTYIIERSMDFLSWTGVFTNIAAENGSVQFSETPATNPAFYRSRSQ